MARVHFRFTYKAFLKGTEEVLITDTAIIVKQAEGTFQIPLRDIKQVSVCGKDSILVGYGTSNEQTFYHTIKAVNSVHVVKDKLLDLIKKNKVRFMPKSIGFN